LSLLILHGFSSLPWLSPLTVVQFSSLLLCPLIVLATYFFMRICGFSKSLSGLASLFSAFSFLVTIGVFAAFISNMMAWIGTLIFSGFLVKSVSLRSKLYCFLATCTLVFILFTYIWSWVFLMIVLACLFLLYFRRHMSSVQMQQLKIVLAVVSSNIVVEVVRGFILQKGSVAMSVASSLAEFGLSLGYPLRFWVFLDATLNSYLAGLFMNPVSLFLAAVGMLSILGNVWQRDFCNFMKCWVVASSFFFPFANIAIQARLLYSVPFFILATLGCVWVMFWIRERFMGRFGQVLVFLFALVFILSNVNYGFRCMYIVSGRFS